MGEKGHKRAVLSVEQELSMQAFQITCPGKYVSLKDILAQCRLELLPFSHLANEFTTPIPFTNGMVVTA